MSSVRLGWLREIFSSPDLGVFVDSHRLRSYYRVSDKVVQHHFEEALEEDLLTLRLAPGARDEEWGW
jgi:hypothetical protein